MKNKTLLMSHGYEIVVGEWGGEMEGGEPFYTSDRLLYEIAGEKLNHQLPMIKYQFIIF